MKSVVKTMTGCLFWMTIILPVNAGEGLLIHAGDHVEKSRIVVSREPRYQGLSVCHGMGGMQRWRFSLKEAGAYFIHACYASGESRPVFLSVNGSRQPKPVFSKKTGGFYPDHLAWETVGPFELKSGENLLQVDAKGHSPHFAGFVVSTSRGEWNRHAFDKKFSIAPLDWAGMTPEELQTKQRELIPCREFLRKRLGCDEILFIKRITYSSTHYYSEFIDSKWTPGGGIFILNLKDGSERQIAAELTGGVFGRLDLSFDAKKIVFDWKSGRDEGYRIYEVSLDPKDQKCNGGAGARLVLPPPPDEPALIERYRIQGFHHGTDDMHPCYLPDGGIAFVSTRCKTSTLCHGGDVFPTTVIYRMDGDGSNLRQLSMNPLSEFAPTVLPDGRIMYARWEYVDKGAVAAKCIWAMRPDGSMSSEIYGNDISFPTTMTQARHIPGHPNQYIILGCPHYPQNALGTVIRLNMNHSIRTTAPMTYLTPEVKILSEPGWHFADGPHSVPDQGSVPTDAYVFDRTGQGPLFRDPWPVDPELILVAHKPRGFGKAYQPNGYGLYTLNGGGKVTPFYRDPAISAWQPIPLKARKCPPNLKSALVPSLAEKKLAQCVVQDIYVGMEKVKRGSIRYIRILEQIARPWDARRPYDKENRATESYDQQYACVSKDTALGLKVQHGIVPVEEDGSANFLVPANANIFFQALDENYLAVQTERTFVNFMPGENRSCIGCHETPEDTPPPTKGSLLALARQPSLPGPQPGETTGRRVLHYPTDVQPILDRSCVSCHSPEKKSGGLDLSSTPTRFFCASYENLIDERRSGRKDRREPDLVPTIGENHPKTGNVHYLPARSLGSHNSVLMAMLMPEGTVQIQGSPERLRRVKRLREVHKKIRLTREELLRISNWVDTNAQYYGSYYGRRNLMYKGHPQFRKHPSWESAVSPVSPLPDHLR